MTHGLTWWFWQVSYVAGTLMAGQQAEPSDHLRRHP